jgi:hypothetical protein
MLVAALAWAGCGTRGLSPGPGSAGTGAGGVAGQGVPEKDGAPIGDCVESSAQELESLGCPVTQPDAETLCSLPDRTVCRYGISVEGGSSYQTLFLCVDGSWGAGVHESCGTVCGMVATKVARIDAQGCEARVPTDCRDDGITYAWPPTALTKVTHEIGDVVRACNAQVYGVLYEIRFDHGCPVQLAVGDNSLTDSQVSCLAARLSQARWDCAVKVPCASYIQVLL